MASNVQNSKSPDASRAKAEVSDEAIEQACLYAAGVLKTEERLRHEAAMDRNQALMALTTDLLETATATILATLPPDQGPSSAVKNRLCRAIEVRSELDFLAKSYLTEPAESTVLTDAAGSIQWVSPGFTAMCGFAADELRGRKPGAILQGALTDLAPVARIREALSSGHACCEELVNYHKNGRPYWVAISINPLRGTDGELRGFLAIERELPDRQIPVVA